LNTGNIVEKFELLSGIESSESIKWRSVVDDGVTLSENEIQQCKIKESEE
jgi:hypothetical protein